MSIAANKRDLAKLLRAANTPELTTAVRFRCDHFPERSGVILSLDAAIEHWNTAFCKPWACATNMETYLFSKGKGNGGA